MSDHASPVKARRRGDVVFAVAMVIAVALLAWIVITIQGLSHDLRTANDARDALARQVQSLGASPVAGSPGSRGDVGQAGARGPRGYSGQPAPAITPSPGKSGAPGASGRPGADSTVPGPSGLPGQPGADSTVAGPQGPAGADGKDGTNGSPPAGWTYTDPQGRVYDCEPVDGFDPDSPRYACAQTGTPGPTDNPSPTEGGLGLAAVASTAAYRKIGGPRAA